ncbi:hypothetical protein GUJ93_ZPchr0012g19971 [Zizania palustris]|uniref:Uncharacterized protein n=1 Tax=Zizania palustris TaxID=103762 RepID=A0A8J5WR72_ZIZPA|nr:hypothetical protein GUJ93_ZPchr0012g19971 [Zizania palustris]
MERGEENLPGSEPPGGLLAVIRARSLLGEATSSFRQKQICIGTTEIGLQILPFCTVSHLRTSNGNKS